MASVAPRRDSVQSVTRAFDILEALAASDELGVTDLATQTGLVPSTAHRLLATLANRGYVSQRADSGRYALGYKLVELASGLEQGLARLRRVARPHLESVQEATEETTNLVVLDGDRVIYVDQVPGSRSVRMFTVVGAAALAHTTAAGKAILAFGPPEVVAALYSDRDELERLTTRTLPTVDALGDDLKRTAKRGYALDNEEHEEGVSCIAAPVLDRDGRPRAAISISAPTARVLHPDTAELGTLLREHADRISEALGHGAQDGDRAAAS
jgi:DNA-binding IclR family transcriptional regulator